MDARERREKSEQFAERNVHELCSELLELGDKGVLKDGMMRELASFWDFKTNSLVIAESFVKAAAFRHIVKQTERLATALRAQGEQERTYELQDAFERAAQIVERMGK